MRLMLLTFRSSFKIKQIRNILHPYCYVLKLYPALMYLLRSLDLSGLSGLTTGSKVGTIL